MKHRGITLGSFWPVEGRSVRSNAHAGCSGCVESVLEKHAFASVLRNKKNKEFAQESGLRSICMQCVGFALGFDSTRLRYGLLVPVSGLYR
jgi:hypothetical protein